jgi:hypothetical protein
MNSPLVWSYTMLESFEQCPKKTFHKFVLKEKEPSTPELEKGIKAHKALELRVKSNHKLPDEFAHYEPIAASIANARKGKKIYTELKLGLNRQFQVVDFFAPDVWGRIALDVFLKEEMQAWIMDYKTGKPNDKELQLTINSVFAFRAFPAVNVITALNIWLKEAPPCAGTPWTFKREDENLYWQEILEIIGRLDAAQEKNNWPARPSGLCGWCPVRSCQHNPKRNTV